MLNLRGYPEQDHCQSSKPCVAKKLAALTRPCESAQESKRHAYSKTCCDKQKRRPSASISRMHTTSDAKTSASECISTAMPVTPNKSTVFSKWSPTCTCSSRDTNDLIARTLSPMYSALIHS